MPPKQYNDMYKNVFHCNNWLRVYDNTAGSFDQDYYIYSELQIRFIELIEKYNFKVFHFFCSPKTNLKIKFKLEDLVNLSDSDTMNVKKLLGKDIYYLYENQLFEVLLTIPHLNDNNNYSFDFILVANENFDLDKVFNYNFNVINVDSVNQMDVNSITYEWAKKFFSKRKIFNNSTSSLDKPYIDNYYDLRSVDLSYKDFIEKYNNGSNEYELEQFHNVSSPIYYGNLNQNKYVSNRFMLLDMQIWSFDVIYIREKNKYGSSISYFELYEINSMFASIFNSDFNNTHVKHDENNNSAPQKDRYYSYCCMYDIFSEYSIMFGGLDKNSVKTGFANLENLEVREKGWQTKWYETELKH